MPRAALAPREALAPVLYSPTMRLHAALALRCALAICAGFVAGCGADAPVEPAWTTTTLAPAADPAAPAPDAPVWIGSGNRTVRESRHATPMLRSEDGRSWSARFPLEGAPAGELELHVGFDGSDGVRARAVLSLDGAESARVALACAPGGSSWTGWRVPAPRASALAELRVEMESGEPKAVHLARPAWRRAAPLAPDGARRPRGVLLVSIDTLRPDRLGADGSTKDLSPHLDRLAARGVVWERALSSAPWTLPSYASLFTARTPLAHGAGLVKKRQEAWPDAGDASNELTRLGDAVPTLAEQFQRAGWATAGLHASPFLEPPSGLHRGFDLWQRHAIRADAGVERALAWIAERGEEPWFLFLHLIDPHLPYAPPDEYMRRHAGVVTADLKAEQFEVDILRRQEPEGALKQLLLALYDAEVAWTDAQLGRLFDGLEANGVLEDIVVALHSDHGEEFWEHGGFEHGHALVESVLHVPLVVAAPGLAPRREGDRVRSMDLGPTLLELAGLASIPGAEGRSLLSGPGGPREVDAEALLYGGLECKAHYAGDARLVWAASAAPVLEGDPGAGAINDGTLRQELRRRMLQRVERLRPALSGEAARHSSETLRELRSIGYTGLDGGR
jgi:arylsulfatase A-like enzyme